MDIISVIPATSRERPYLLVGQFLSGAYANGLSYLGGKVCGNASLTTYDELEKVARRKDIADGAYVLDKRHLGDSGAAIDAVFRGPMLDGQLPVCTIRRLFESNVTYNSTSDALASEIHGTDFVSIDIYVEFWRKLGAKVGRRIGDSIAWEH